MADTVNISAYLSQGAFAALRQYAFQETVQRSDIIAVALDHLFTRWANDPSIIAHDLEEAKSVPERVPVRFEAPSDHVKNWRGRRLLACRSADQLRSVVNNLHQDDGQHPRSTPTPPLTPELQNELRNMVNLTLRMILAMNDGQISPETLRSF